MAVSALIQPGQGRKRRTQRVRESVEDLGGRSMSAMSSGAGCESGEAFSRSESRRAQGPMGTCGGPAHRCVLVDDAVHPSPGHIGENLRGDVTATRSAADGEILLTGSDDLGDRS